MLPQLLCEQLCSLNPGVDRLTFSVIWKVDADGRIMDEWFGRSVIRSCSKLTYDIAQVKFDFSTHEIVIFNQEFFQGFIDEPEREWSLEELPPISSNRTPREIANS